MGSATETTVNNDSLSDTAQERVMDEQPSLPEHAQDKAQWNDLIERKKRSLAATAQEVQQDTAAGSVTAAGSGKV
ncbi:MAG: hypothetical protein OEN50_03825 [Deltaproteobacteria bacterium]|nr:hypothetical protein [Deltaproteobacteria bacterium]